MIYLILFIYLFNPPILPFNLVHILAVMSILYLVFVARKNVLQLLKKSNFIVFIILMTTAICYLFAIIFASKKTYEALLQYILILENIPIILSIYCYCERKKITLYSLIKKIIIVGTAQGIIAIIAYINPNIQEYLVNILIKNGYGIVLKQLAAHRIYGFASNLTYSTPALQTFLAIITMEMIIIKKEKWLYLCIPSLIISAIINARISIGILLIGGLCIIIFNMNKKNYKIMAILTILICMVIVCISSYTGNNSNIKWIKDGVNEITAFFKGETTGYFDTLINKFMIFPKGIELIGGSGDFIFGKQGVNSDVGFINDIWMGGLLLCIVLYTANVYVILKVKIDNKNIRNFYILFTLLTLIIMNIKGIYTQGNNVLNLIMLIFGLSNMMYDKKELKNEQSFDNYNH